MSRKLRSNECGRECELSGEAICVFVCSIVALPVLLRASDLCCGRTEEEEGDNMGEDMTRRAAGDAAGGLREAVGG